jgi:hypothetical protein
MEGSSEELKGRASTAINGNLIVSSPLFQTNYCIQSLPTAATFRAFGCLLLALLEGYIPTKRSLDSNVAYFVARAVSMALQVKRCEPTLVSQLGWV